MAPSAGFRPIDLRFRFAAQALQRVGLAAEILTLLALGTDGVGLGDFLPFPAAQGRAEQTARQHDSLNLRGTCVRTSLAARATVGCGRWTSIITFKQSPRLTKYCTVSQLGSKRTTTQFVRTSDSWTWSDPRASSSTRRATGNSP